MAKNNNLEAQLPSKRKFGLVIQGALMSVGRTGDKLHQTPDQLKKEGGIVNYDCRENINKIIKDFGHLFDQIVVSVFDNQLKPEDNFLGAKIVSSPDLGGILQVGHYKDNNKARQFVSTLNGLIELEKSGIEYAIKTRTDTYLDLNKLIESFFANDTKKIGTTMIHPPTYLLHDLYFMAELKNLKRFCEAVLAFRRFEFISSVHRDMLLKHAFVEYRDKIGVNDSDYFPNFPPDGISLGVRKIFDYMFANAYFSLGPEIWRGTLWRGTHFAPDHFASLLHGNKSTRIYNLPALITTDWNRYFQFMNETQNRSKTLPDKVKARIGLFGWQLWQMFRKMVRYFV